MRTVSGSQEQAPGLPPAFLERMEQLLGQEYGAFLESLHCSPSLGLRVNLLKISPAVLCSLVPFDLVPLPWPAAFIVLESDQPGKHPYHAAGLYYLQDPSAMVVVELLAPMPGERVLDLAAAPGGKATHIASLMRGKGLLIANDIHAGRARDLAENLERWGARNAAVLNETPERLAHRFEGFFDRVLLDAPCSGEGMFRKSASARRDWSPQLVAGCARRQTAILQQAARMVRPGGILVYATCTFAPEEDEEVVAHFLRESPEFHMVEPLRWPGCLAARHDWVKEGSPSEELRHAVRMWPHIGPGEGHFAAAMRRGDEPARGRLERPEALAESGRAAAPTRRHPARSGHDLRPTATDRQAVDAYQAFCSRHLAASPADERLHLFGMHLYVTPVGLPDLTGLRFIHPGWRLGTVHNGRFEPSHAMAMAIPATLAGQCHDLQPTDAAVISYLLGQSLDSAGEDGWALVTVDGFPLGWGKRVKGTLKSHYPKGLRPRGRWPV